MIKTYDFGADIKNINANERKALAWPVAIWTCYIPESETQEINILEHLILQLVDKGYKDPERILCSKIGFNSELVEAAIEACGNEDYFDRRYKELTLSADGKSVLGAVNNPYEADLNASRKNKKIYMVQDLVTKSVVPIFDIEKLPQFFFEDEDVISIRYENFTGKKPRSASVKTAMRYWGKLCNNRRHGLIIGSNTIDISQPPSALKEIEDFIPFEDEVDWENIQNDGSTKEEPVRTLADKEEEERQKKEEDDIKNLTILDDSPEIYMARGFIAINKNSPDEAIIISPFGDVLDDWFRTVINRLRTCDSAFEEEIQLFLMMKRDELKDSIAFGNELNIQLFNEYPFVCNDNKFRDLKASIQGLTVSKNRFTNGEDDTKYFVHAIRNAYEAMLRMVVVNNKDLLEYRSLSLDEYRSNLEKLTESYNFFGDDTYREYSSKNMHRNMTSVSEKDGYATAFVALLLMDAWNNKDGKSMDLFRNVENIAIIIKDRTSTLSSKRNKNDGGTSFHAVSGFADIVYSTEEVENQYLEFEMLFRAIYNRFMEDR